MLMRPGSSFRQSACLQSLRSALVLTGSPAQNCSCEHPSAHPLSPLFMRVSESGLRVRDCYCAVLTHARPDTVRCRGAARVKGSNHQAQSRAASHGADLERTVPSGKDRGQNPSKGMCHK